MCWYDFCNKQKKVVTSPNNNTLSDYIMETGFVLLTVKSGFSSKVQVGVAETFSLASPFWVRKITISTHSCSCICCIRMIGIQN